MKKRENFRKAFDNFDYNKIADYKADKINSLMNDAGIIRNRLKIDATINNAKAFIKIRKNLVPSANISGPLHLENLLLILLNL